MFRRISLAAAVLLGSCGVRSEVGRAKYTGPIAKPAWKADGIMVDRVFIENEILYCRARTFADPARHLYAFDAASGTRLWITDFEIDLGAPHFFAGDALVLRDAASAVHIVNAKTGAPLDRPALHGTLRGVTADGVTYVVGMGRLTAIDNTTQHELWHTDLVGEVTDGPVVAGGNVYITGIIAEAFDIKTGIRRWMWKYPGSLSAIAADASAAYVYNSSQTAAIVALDPATGAEKWRQSLLSVNLVESPTLIGTDQLLIRDFPGGRSAPLAWTGYTFRTVKRATGEKVSEATTTWKYGLWNIANGQLFASDKSNGKLLNEGGDSIPDSWLTAVSLATGKELWRSETVHFGVFTAPATGSGVVAVGIAPYNAPIPHRDDPTPAGLWVFKAVQ